MMTQRPLTTGQPTRSRTRGVTLVELMVGLAIGLMALRNLVRGALELPA